jgi:hypothetical protein
MKHKKEQKGGSKSSGNGNDNGSNNSTDLEDNDDDTNDADNNDDAANRKGDTTTTAYYQHSGSKCNHHTSYPVLPTAKQIANYLPNNASRSISMSSSSSSSTAATINSPSPLSPFNLPTSGSNVYNNADNMNTGNMYQQQATSTTSVDQLTAKTTSTGPPTSTATDIITTAVTTSPYYATHTQSTYFPNDTIQPTTSDSNSFAHHPIISSSPYGHNQRFNSYYEYNPYSSPTTTTTSAATTSTMSTTPLLGYQSYSTNDYYIHQNSAYAGCPSYYHASYPSACGNNRIYPEYLLESQVAQQTASTAAPAYQYQLDFMGSSLGQTCQINNITANPDSFMQTNGKLSGKQATIMHSL